MTLNIILKLQHIQRHINTWHIILCLLHIVWWVQLLSWMIWTLFLFPLSGENLECFCNHYLSSISSLWKTRKSTYMISQLFLKQEESTISISNSIPNANITYKNCLPCTCLYSLFTCCAIYSIQYTDNSSN